MEEKKVEEQKPQVPAQARSKKWILGIVGGVLLALIALVVFLPQPYYTEGFKTLSELQEYAQTIDENIKMEGKNFVKPSYESYYQKNFGPSLLRTFKEKIVWLLYYFGLHRRPLFSSSFFKKMLIDVLEDRGQQGWSGDFVQKIQVNQDSRIVVFGSIQGAFHPLVRYLEKLKELNIIDENLIIKNPNDYFIFLGNVVNRCPYTIELLSVVLRLLNENPKNVFYLRGLNESSHAWVQHSLKRELELRAYFLSDSVIPLQHEVSNFFDTLPITVYCMIQAAQEKELNYFKIMPHIESESLLKLLDESRYSAFLEDITDGSNISVFDLHKNSPRELVDRIQLIKRAIICDIKKRESYEEMDGMRKLHSSDKTTIWTVLSTSSEIYRSALNFFYDAFVIVFSAQNLEDWKITLFKRDVRNKDKNFEQRSERFFQN
ncbi:hypothetical protein IPF37_06000 [bacterium]|nr:MAG: hypothetical protein IPF37_06000 [bacterium]